MPLFRNIPGNTTSGFTFEGEAFGPDANGHFEAPLGFMDYAQAHGLELVPDQPASAFVPPAPPPAAAPSVGPTLILGEAPGGGLTLTPADAQAASAGAPTEATQAAGGGSQEILPPAPAKPVMQWSNDELQAELKRHNLEVNPWDRPTAIRTVSAARKPKE